jgi:dTDP-L-rhamnose 4-epimerase
VHVRDVARANVLALGAAAEGSFNIASGEPRTIGDMAAVLARASAREDLTPVVTGQYRLGDVRHVVASPERARRSLGFEASVSFDEGVAEFATAPLRVPAR